MNGFIKEIMTEDNTTWLYKNIDNYTNKSIFKYHASSEWIWYTLIQVSWKDIYWNASMML